jgi:hypothetical protein
MFSEIVEAVKQSTEPQIVTVNGQEYADRVLHLPPQEPTVEPLHVSTLSGLVEYVNQDPDTTAECDGYQGIFIQVCSPTHIKLVAPFSGRHANRPILLKADCTSFVSGFSYGHYHPIEQFIIALISQFDQTDDRHNLLQIIGNIKDERVGQFGDDGVTQAVSIRKGLSLGDSVAIPKIVNLKPYRTFAEIEQPTSKFNIRLKQGKEGEAPTAALFEADGGRWKLEAIQSIAAYLKQNLPETTIIA